MKTNAPYKQITVILPMGKGLDVIEALKEEKNIVSANLNYARGVGRMTPLRFRGVGEQTEKEIINVVLPAPIADDIYDYIYDFACINNPHAGILYMSELSMSNDFTLPENINEED